MAFARSFVALVALLCFAIVAVVRAQAASGDVTKLQIGVKVRARAGKGVMKSMGRRDRSNQSNGHARALLLPLPPAFALPFLVSLS
jgi:hypothetical protein